jgi:NAD(P)-dependent dehydrogenase (short-subunit alcohol dehydrogenase family)
MKFQFDQRTALVPGSTRGIGWEKAKEMAEAGASG